jgi:hypothetical protein
LAIDFKSLNRQTQWNVAQKKVLKKIFSAAQDAAVERKPSLIDTVVIHRALAGEFEGDKRYDIQALMTALKRAIIVRDRNFKLDSTIGAFRMGGRERRYLRNVAESVLSQIEGSP